jgi:hypothetical protein
MGSSYLGHGNFFFRGFHFAFRLAGHSDLLGRVVLSPGDQVGPSVGQLVLYDGPNGDDDAGNASRNAAGHLVRQHVNVDAFEIDEVHLDAERLRHYRIRTLALDGQLDGQTGLPAEPDGEEPDAGHLLAAAHIQIADQVARVAGFVPDHLQHHGSVPRVAVRLLGRHQRVHAYVTSGRRRQPLAARTQLREDAEVTGGNVLRHAPEDAGSLALHHGQSVRLRRNPDVQRRRADGRRRSVVHQRGSDGQLQQRLAVVVQTHGPGVQRRGGSGQRLQAALRVHPALSVAGIESAGDGLPGQLPETVGQRPQMDQGHRFRVAEVDVADLRGSAVPVHAEHLGAVVLQVAAVAAADQVADVERRFRLGAGVGGGRVELFVDEGQLVGRGQLDVEAGQRFEVRDDHSDGVGFGNGRSVRRIAGAGRVLGRFRIGRFGRSIAGKTRSNI